MHTVFACPPLSLLAALTVIFACISTAMADGCNAHDATLCLLAENDFTAEPEGLSLLHRDARAMLSPNGTHTASIDSKAKAAPRVIEAAPTGNKAKVAPTIIQDQTGDKANIPPKVTEVAPAITEALVAPTGIEALNVSANSEETNEKVEEKAIMMSNKGMHPPANTKVAPAIREAQVAPTGIEALTLSADTDETKNKVEREIHNNVETIKQWSQHGAHLPAKWNNLVDKNYKHQIREGYVSVVVICVICVVLTFIVKMFSWMGSVKPANLLDHEWQQAEVSLRAHRASG